MRLAVSLDGQSFEEPRIIATPKDFKKGMEIFKENAISLARGGKILTAAGGVRALDKSRQKLLSNHPLIDFWAGEPIHDALQNALDAPVYLENDAAMVGLGEAAFGAGKGYRVVAYMTVSTGVGGARIVDQKIDISMMGFEPGHQIIIDWADNLKIKYLEEYISGHSIRQRFSKEPAEIKSEKFWDDLARFLAIGLNNTIVHWSPDCVVLGGGIMENISLERVILNLRQYLKIFPEMPEIKRAELGESGGLYGALSYLNPNVS